MRVTALVLAGIVAGCTRVGLPPKQAADADTLESKTVALVMTDMGPPRAFCTGVWIDAATIATAGHCVEDLASGEFLSFVTEENGEVRAAMMLVLDPEHDLALIRAVDPPSHGTAVLRSSPVARGERCYSMGHPKGLWYSFSSGDVAAVRVERIGVLAEWVQCTAPTSPGNSGGGVFDAEGRLIGITSRTLLSAQNVNFAVHVDHLRDLVDGERP